MRYLSLFSGIEAASVAWHPLGWTPVAFAEVSPMSCALLKHHYPQVPNLGDVTKVSRQQIQDLGAIDLVVFGSPCQDVSVAGKRGGLKAKRSGLFFDAMRIVRWSRARFALFENVPGLFSSNDGRDFASVVGEMAGVEFDVPTSGWRNTGVALGRDGLVEWSVLDAQWFGVPQRRRRIFALRDIGDWSSRPPILFIPESLRGYSAPRREAGERAAPTLEGRAGRSGCNNFATSGGLEVTCANVAPTLSTSWGDRSAGSTAQEWNSEKGGRFIAISPTLRAGKNLTGGDRPPGTDVDTCDSLVVVGSLQSGASPNGHVAGGGTSSKAHALTMSAVRRLTPEECESHQGFPRGYTKVPYRGKPAADGPRYAAIGNSFAVPVVRWIGERIDTIESRGLAHLERIA